jgi:hypothetical protein
MEIVCFIRLNRPKNLVRDCKEVILIFEVGLSVVSSSRSYPSMTDSCARPDSPYLGRVPWASTFMRHDSKNNGFGFFTVIDCTRVKLHGSLDSFTSSTQQGV